MNTQAPTALEWEVNGLRLAGLSWGEAGARPVLALHGWLDNAASFSMLAPLLTQHHVVAVDLSGHGMSAQRSPDATYQIWDDLPELLGVLEGLGWQRFALMGHSRGAVIASLLASVITERVERLVLLDGVVPREVGEDQFPRQLRKFLDEKRHWQQRNNRVYNSIDAAAASRTGTSPSPAAARVLVERNLRPCEVGYTWTTDLRLRGASAVKMTGGQIEAVLDALTMPTLLLLAQEGFGKHPGILDQARRHIRGLEVEVMAGGHHFHMEPGVATVAQRIGAFLQR
ncbi:MAG: alpha/beta fold hydrolase [Halioglobus sp.]|nr:alpha/beta fold hydrolase [Halioglobus sp.]